MKKLLVKVYSTCCNDICDSLIEKLEKLSSLDIIDLEEINLYSNEGIEVSKKYGIQSTMFTVVFDKGKEILNFEGTHNIPQLIKNYIIMTEEKENPIEETNPDTGEDFGVEDTKKKDGDKYRRVGNGGDVFLSDKKKKEPELKKG